MAKKKSTCTAHSESRFLIREFLEAPGGEFSVTPDRFVMELSSYEAADNLIFNNFVSLTVPSGCTHRSAVEQIAVSASKPFQINSVSGVLEQERFLRGCTYFRHVWAMLDELCMNWPKMYWWYSEQGLSIAPMEAHELTATIKIRQLSPFDQLAGKLFMEAMVEGRVSDEALLEIARALDRQGFGLKENLKPSDWKPIADYNQKYSRKAISNFEGALRVNKAGIRGRLSEAKIKYEKAIRI